MNMTVSNNGHDSVRINGIDFHICYLPYRLIYVVKILDQIKHQDMQMAHPKHEDFIEIYGDLPLWLQFRFIFVVTYAICKHREDS